MSDTLKTIRFKITGIRPLLMHNGVIADPMNPGVKAMKKITAKGSKKMTDTDYEELARLSWEYGIYWSSDFNDIVILSDNIERCIQLGAQKQRKGKDFAAAAFVTETEILVKHRRNGTSKADLYADPAYKLTKGVGVNGSRVMRIRPMVPTGWSASFTIEFDSSIIQRDLIVDALRDAGSLVGLGDWRPKFGRFEVEVLP